MTRSLLALALVAALPVAAHAQERSSGLNYNYVEGGYVATNLDHADGDFDADGVGGNVSFAISPNFHLFGGITAQDSDDFSFLGSRVSTDLKQWRAGIGYNLPIAANTDLLARVAYEKLEIDDVTVDGIRYGVNDGDDGASVEVGVRSALAASLEGYALAGYEDFGHGNDDVYGRVGAQWKFNPSWGVSGEVKFNGDDTQWFVGPRFSW